LFQIVTICQLRALNPYIIKTKLFTRFFRGSKHGNFKKIIKLTDM
jgi:hypothetical protein